MKIRCQDCGRIVEVDKDWDTNATCNECAGYFAELNSEDDTWEEDSDKENEDDSDEISCIICGNDIEEGKYLEWNEDEYDDYSDYDRLIICKKCIDKKYPRELKTEIKEVVKFIEKEPLIQSKFTEGKSKFD